MTIQGNIDVLKSITAHTHIKIFSGNPDTIKALSGPFTPAQMKKAYGIDQVMFGEIVGDGTGQTIAIVDAYLYENAHSDFVTFCNEYGLPTTGLTTMTQQDLLNDSSGTPPTDAGWNLEEALDIQWAHAIAPGANIILIQAHSSSYSDLFACVAGAAQLSGVSAISMSWSSSTFSGENDYDYIFTTPNGHQGVTFCASTGDNGEPGGYPADSLNVIAVGGTSLTTDGSGNYSSESGWNGSGGGVSPYENLPSYQYYTVKHSPTLISESINPTKRCQPDVSFDADPDTGVLVYCNSGSYTGWIQVGGTSLASPCWAGIIAISNQGRVINGLPTLNGIKDTLPTLYGMPISKFHDVTTGNNGFAAGSGYDLVTGRGTPTTGLINYLSVSNVAANGMSSANGVFNTINFSSFNVATSGAATGYSTSEEIIYSEIDVTGVSFTSFVSRAGYGISKTVTVLEPVASFTDNSPQNLGTAITFTDTSGGAVSWAWDFGDEVGTSTSQNPYYTYTNTGTYIVTLTINSGEAEISNSVTVNVITSYIWQNIDLSNDFNVIGIVPNGDAGEDGSGLDGSAAQNTPPSNEVSSLNGTLLLDLFGNPVTVDGVKFKFNLANSNNTIYCNGQVIPLSGACFDYIYMLGFGTNNGTGGGYADFIVTYSDTTTNTISLQFSDWFNSSNGYENETVALGSDNNLYRSDSNGPIFIFKYTLAVDRTKNAVSLTLPIYNNLDIFAISEASVVPQMGMWVSGDSLEEMVGYSDGTVIEAWNDISGNSNDLLQTTDDLRPTFYTNIINGLPAVHFTGSSLSGDNYTAGKYMTRSLSIPANYTVITVMRREVADGYFQVAESIGAATGFTFWQGYIANDGVEIEQNDLIVGSDSHNDLYNPNANNEDGWHIAESRFAGTYLEGWSSGVSPNPILGQNNLDGNNNISSGNLSSGLVTIGAYSNQTLFFNGYIAETLIFNVAVSDSDREVIESYLIYKYNLQTKNEIQKITLSPLPNSGTLTITVNGQTTESILFSASATDVQSAINTALGADNTIVT